MSIITKFLKLVKPERNDYVNVEEHISKNYDRIDTWATQLDEDTVKKEKIANNLTTEEEGYVLGAGQGKILDDKKFDKGKVSKEFDTAEKIEKLLKGNSGITDVIYIQDAGTKTYEKGYIDKETGELYMCIVESTDSVDVDSNFMLATNIKNATTQRSYLIKSGSTSTGNYRIYSDGFIEQWGTVQASGGTGTVTLPYEMADTSYFANACIQDGGSWYGSCFVYEMKVKQFKVYGRSYENGHNSYLSGKVHWEVKGKVLVNEDTGEDGSGSWYPGGDGSHSGGTDSENRQGV